MFERIKEKVLTQDQLADLRKKYKDKKIVFCTGCYDILQSGHAVFFNQCKEFGDILVVGIGTDKVISVLKGSGRPVNPEINRLYLVAAMQEVDYVVLNDSELTRGKVDFYHLNDKLRPDYFVINDDDSDLEGKLMVCNSFNIKPVYVPRIVPPELKATSTTRIIDKINFAYKAPLRIDFAGGWSDVPYIMEEQKGYVSNVAIKPIIEHKAGKFNFSGYPRGSGLSTSTAAKLLEMIAAKNYNAETKSLSVIAEDLFKLENSELNWAIGRQDQYSIVFGGFNCFEFSSDYAKPLEPKIAIKTLEQFRENLLLFHTGVSRNAQQAVEQVYHNYKTPKGKKALAKISAYGKLFFETLQKNDFKACAEIMTANFAAQRELADASSNEYIDNMFDYAFKNGAYGAKICGAGGGGALVLYCKDPQNLKKLIKKQFVDCFEIDFDFEYNNIKDLNKV